MGSLGGAPNEPSGIYIYAVELKTGPIFAFSSVLVLETGPSFCFLLLFFENTVLPAERRGFFKKKQKQKTHF